ncbi:MAG: nucleotidyltransferase family protein, partial [Oscillospiraceae bacterium]
MKTAAIIAEFNPFHNGHEYLITKARELGYTCIIAIMSGNFVQRGDLAVFSKFSRAHAAVLCGVDAVVELPTPFAMSGAQQFATGGVYIAKQLGVDAIIFGSECGD